MPVKKYPGPCIICGTNKSTSNRFIKKLCNACYQRQYNRTKNPLGVRQCSECGIDLVPNKKRLTRTMCVRCQRRRHYQENGEKRKEGTRKYRKTPKGRSSERFQTVKRRARLALVESTLTRDEWDLVLAEYENRCAYCGSSKYIETDHVIPLAKKGPHSADNVVPACRSCNASKGDSDLDEWLASRPPVHKNRNRTD